MTTNDLDAEFNAKLTCDLTPFGLGLVECDANIAFGPSDDPESVEISFPATRGQIGELYSSQGLDLAHYFGAPEFHGTVIDSDTAFKGSIVLVKRMQPIGMFEGVRLTCFIEDFEFLDGSEEVDASIVVFRLTNVPHRLRGDTGVVRPVSDQPPTPLQTDYFLTSELSTLSDDDKKERFRAGWQFSASRINFRYGGRDWSLDTTQGHKDGKAKVSQLRPMVTATLTTQAEETNDSVETLADHVCDLLTFAFGKEVRWVSCGRFSPDGPARATCRSFPLLPYGKGAGSLVDNWELGNLKHFLQESESAFNTNPDWWHRSIGLLAHSRATPLVEIRLATLNTLTDRISHKVIGDQEHVEIDSALPQRIKRRWFRWALHWLLRTLSRNWDQKRTATVCDTIIGWNSRPSFPSQVSRACDVLAISVPARKHLGFRHKLIHVGEFDKKLKTKDKMIEYLQSLEAVVELMMIRMLGFTGYVHIDERGPDYQQVEALLKAEDADHAAATKR